VVDDGEQEARKLSPVSSPRLQMKWEPRRPAAQSEIKHQRRAHLQSAVCMSVCMLCSPAAVCTGTGSGSGSFAYSGSLSLTSLFICLPPSASPPFPSLRPVQPHGCSSRRPAYPQARAASGRAKRIGPEGARKPACPLFSPRARPSSNLNFWDHGAVAGVCVLQYQNSSIIINITTITNTV
jgi:hypothetical protein